MRSGFVEGRHYGRLLAVGPDGETVLAVGPVEEPIFPRSCNKPLQGWGMLLAGLGDVVGVDDRLLAVACASHAGTPRHLEMVRLLLRLAELDARALRNTPGLPLDHQAALAVIRSGGGPDPLLHNCSGKHAAMLATCIAAGWPVGSYLAPEHPLQLHLRRAVADLAGEHPPTVGVDGCGAPLFALTLAGLARAYRRLITGTGQERRVADAMRRHPELVDGHGRPATSLMRGIPGALAKGGAEGVYAAALSDGSVCVVKIDDGSARAALPAIVAGLRVLGAQGAVLDELATSPVFGHGRVVGQVRSCVS